MQRILSQGNGNEMWEMRQGVERCRWESAKHPGAALGCLGVREKHSRHIVLGMKSASIQRFSLTAALHSLQQHYSTISPMAGMVGSN